jgi:hypothetical protein
MIGLNDVEIFLLIIWILLNTFGLKRLISVAKKHPQKNSLRIGAIFYIIVVGVLPLILIKEEVISNSALNIVLSGGAVIYFAVLLSRIGQANNEHFNDDL